jgi:CobQ-like glutamine amidotransferase family enzyme
VSEREIRVLHLFDQYLNIYADRGNMMVLQQRCAWRGIACSISGLEIDEMFDPNDFDLIYVGGGQDRDQRMIAERMAGDVGGALRAAAEADTPVLAVCGGYQLLGEYYLDVSGVKQPGANVLGLHTEAGDTRLIGNVCIEARLPSLTGGEQERVTIAGFENHAGRTTLHDGAVPLGKVTHGAGNDGESGFEGCVSHRVIGTYLHGPLLPRNPALADWLIAAAVQSRDGEVPALEAVSPTISEFESRARSVLIDRAAGERR